LGVASIVLIPLLIGAPKPTGALLSVNLALVTTPDDHAMRAEPPSHPNPLTDSEAYVDFVLRQRLPHGGAAVSAAAAFIKRWFKPTFVGLERLPKGPALFVANHSLLAVDATVFHLLFHYDHNRFLRPLGDKTLFAQPQYARLCHSLGACCGYGDVIRGLMREGTDLLLYPGGTWEAIKPPEQRYELQWKERFGFVRIAAEMGYTIMPFASVGPDEYYDQHLTGEQVLHSKLMQTLISAGVVPGDLRADIVPPLPAGTFGSPMPKPKPTFFGFGRPVDLSEYAGKSLTKRQLTAIRNRVSGEIDEQIKSLLLLREQRRHTDSLLRRVLNL
jgi:1-acyl-sn-glycerol-3-phosphate acyltransferase